MIILKKIGLDSLLAGAILLCAAAPMTMAAEVSGVQFNDTDTVAGKELRLNGAGLRTKFVLRIWLGDKPADRSLKPQLLGNPR